MFQLVRYLKQFKKQVILGPLFKLTEAVFELIVPLVMASIIDVGVKNGDSAYILRMGGVMVILGVVGLGCALTCQYFASRASQGVGTAIRNDLFAHINSLSMAEIDQIGTPSLVNRINNDVNQLQVAVAMLIRLVVRAPFLVIGSTVMAMILDWRLSLIFLASIPLIALVLYGIMSRCVPFFRSVQKHLDRISLVTRENLEGARVIRAFSAQEAERGRFEEANAGYTKESVRAGKISALLNPLTYVIANTAILGIIWFGGMRVDGGALTQGEIIALVNYMTQILLALIVVANLVIIFTKAQASAVRVNEVFALQSSIRDPEAAGAEPETAPQNGIPKIEFQDVSFSYPQSSEYALRSLSVVIWPGETIGVIGGTGSGKSTLIGLIPRLFDVTEGSIRIDGRDVREYPLSELREKVATASQRATLFHATVRENVAFGAPNASDEDIAKALEISQSAEFVDKLEQKWDTMVAQGGKSLSGGQRQRLSIARALAAKPEILILDDSLSALDFKTDSKLRQALYQYEKDTTVILVSQRASALRNADKIIVLDDGSVAGIGTHEELLQTCSVYQEICASQLDVQKEGGKAV